MLTYGNIIPLTTPGRHSAAGFGWLLAWIEWCNGNEILVQIWCNQLQQPTVNCTSLHPVAVIAPKKNLYSGRKMARSSRRKRMPACFSSI